jgi:hypothetical protein
MEKAPRRETPAGLPDNDNDNDNDNNNINLSRTQTPPTLCNVVHLPSTTLYSVIPPFFRSPFAS